MSEKPASEKPTSEKPTSEKGWLLKTIDTGAKIAGGLATLAAAAVLWTTYLMTRGEVDSLVKKVETLRDQVTAGQVRMADIEKEQSTLKDVLKSIKPGDRELLAAVMPLVRQNEKELKMLDNFPKFENRIDKIDIRLAGSLLAASQLREPSTSRDTPTNHKEESDGFVVVELGDAYVEVELKIDGKSAASSKSNNTGFTHLVRNGSTWRLEAVSNPNTKLGELKVSFVPLKISN